MNSIKKVLTNKVVKMEEGPLMLVRDGFGCHPDLSGTALFGYAEGYGEIRVDGMEVERLATEEETEAFFGRTGLERP